MARQQKKHTYYGNLSDENSASTEETYIIGK